MKTGKWIKKIVISIFLLMLFSSFAGVARGSGAAGGVQISEIMYNPSTEQGKDAYNEWVILHNMNDYAVDVRGWELGGDELIGDAEHGNGTTIIPAHGYAIVTDLNTEVYEHFMVNVSFVRLNVNANAITRYGLNNKGDEITLEDGNGNMIDDVTYSPKWGGNGNGHTIIKENGEWEESEKIAGSLWSPAIIKAKGKVLGWTVNEKRYHINYYGISVNFTELRTWNVTIMFKNLSSNEYEHIEKYQTNKNIVVNYTDNEIYNFRKHTVNGISLRGGFEKSNYEINGNESYEIHIFVTNRSTGENYTYEKILNSLNKDSDGDGLSVLDEEYYYSKWYPSLNPKSKDSDGDNWKDGDEIIKYDTNPVNDDTDGDGVMDSRDILPLGKVNLVFHVYHIWQLDSLNSGKANFHVKVTYSYQKNNGEWSGYYEVNSPTWTQNPMPAAPYWNVNLNKIGEDAKDRVKMWIKLYSGGEQCDIDPLPQDGNMKTLYSVYSIRNESWSSTVTGVGDDSITDPTISFVYNYEHNKWGDDYQTTTTTTWGYGFVNGEDDRIPGDDNDAAMLFGITWNDNDGDMLPYWREVNVYHTDPNFNDSGGEKICDADGDGIPNYYEDTFYPYMNPVNADDKWSDTDGDNVPNIIEYRLYFSPAAHKDGWVYLQKLYEYEDNRFKAYEGFGHALNPNENFNDWWKNYTISLYRTAYDLLNPTDTFREITGDLFLKYISVTSEELSEYLGGISMVISTPISAYEFMKIAENWKENIRTIAAINDISQIEIMKETSKPLREHFWTIAGCCGYEQEGVGLSIHEIEEILNSILDGNALKDNWIKLSNLYKNQRDRLWGYGWEYKPHWQQLPNYLRSTIVTEIYDYIKTLEGFAFQNNLNKIMEYVEGDLVYVDCMYSFLKGIGGE